VTAEISECTAKVYHFQNLSLEYRRNSWSLRMWGRAIEWKVIISGLIPSCNSVPAPHPLSVFVSIVSNPSDSCAVKLSPSTSSDDRCKALCVHILHLSLQWMTCLFLAHFSAGRPPPPHPLTGTFALSRSSIRSLCLACMFCG